MAEDTNQEGGIAKYIQSYMWVMGEMHNEQVMHFVDFIFFFHILLSLQSSSISHCRLPLQHCGKQYALWVSWLMVIRCEIVTGRAWLLLWFFFIIHGYVLHDPQHFIFFYLEFLSYPYSCFHINITFCHKNDFFFFNKSYLVCDYFSFLEF